MILILAACLCLGYYLACGIRFSFRTSLLWGWLAAAAYFSLLFCLPARARHWGLTPFVLYLVFLALFLRKSAGADAPLPADAILVPGSRADGGMPPRFLESRAEAARALWEKKPVPVTLTGGRVGWETEPEAETLRAFLVKAGVDGKWIRMETKARTTRENLLFSAPLLADAKRVAVVTHAFHRRRVLALAGKALPGKEIVFACPAEKTGVLTLHLYLRESFTFLADLVRKRTSL